MYILEVFLPFVDSVSATANKKTVCGVKMLNQQRLIATICKAGMYR